MQNMDGPGFGHIDMRGLRFLAAVLEQRNITRAGKSLGLSQPAASRLLSQLRRALGDDPLLVRTSSGDYTLTAFAAELVPMVNEAIAAAGRIFSRPKFDPATSTRKFRIATTDYGASVVMAKVAERVAREAPAISLEVRAWDAATLSGMEDGFIDLALYTDESLPAGFYNQRLFNESFACIVRRGHPVLANRDADGRIDPAQLAALPRVVLLYPDRDTTAIDDPLGDHGRRHGAGDFLTPYFLSGPLLVTSSNHVLCTTRRTALLAATFADIEVIDFAEAGHFDYCVIWHSRVDLDLGVAWMRQNMAAATNIPS